MDGERNETVLATVPMYDLVPVVTARQLIDRMKVLQEIIQQAMVRNVDYGVVPGTGGKPTLLKPGAEKLCAIFALAPKFIVESCVEDFTGAAHNGETFLCYSYTCELWRGDWRVASASGTCNSWEKKYRWRSAERVCPVCSKPAIRRGKQEYGGGWFCSRRDGGCGASFPAGTDSIEGQETGQIANPDVADLQNTIVKMSQKRSLVAAVLIATMASSLFSQDVEDFHPVGDEAPAAPAAGERRERGSAGAAGGSDPQSYVCSEQGCARTMTQGQYEFSVKSFGRALCPQCQKRGKQPEAAPPAPEAQRPQNVDAQGVIHDEPVDDPFGPAEDAQPLEPACTECERSTTKGQMTQSHAIHGVVLCPACARKRQGNGNGKVAQGTLDEAPAGG